MPLKSGKGPKAHSQNVQEMLHKFKQTGKIGASDPANMGKAMSQANAIAYKAGESKGEGPKHERREPSKERRSEGDKMLPKRAPPKKTPMSGPAISQFHARPQGKSLPYPQKR